MVIFTSVDPLVNANPGNKKYGNADLGKFTLKHKINELRNVIIKLLNY